MCDESAGYCRIRFFEGSKIIVLKQYWLLGPKKLLSPNATLCHGQFSCSNFIFFSGLPFAKKKGAGYVPPFGGTHTNLYSFMRGLQECPRLLELDCTELPLILFESWRKLRSFGWFLASYLPINWLVVWNSFYFSIYWECYHPNWRTHIFQMRRSTTNQFIINHY